MINYKKILLVCVYFIGMMFGSKHSYIGVTCRKGKWQAKILIKDKQVYGGCFDDPLDAAKRVNQLCDEHEIKHKNIGIGADPYFSEKKSKSGFECVWKKSCKGKPSWVSQVRFNGKFAWASYDNELDAAKRVNQMCDEFGIPRKNPTIGADPPAKRTKGMSSYRGVHMVGEKWRSRVRIEGKLYSGGTYGTDEEAARKVNEMCEYAGLEHSNPQLSTDNQKKENFHMLNSYVGKGKRKRYRKVNGEEEEESAEEQPDFEDTTNVPKSHSRKIVSNSNESSYDDTICHSDEETFDRKENELNEMNKYEEDSTFQKLDTPTYTLSNVKDYRIEFEIPQEKLDDFPDLKDALRQGKDSLQKFMEFRGNSALFVAAKYGLAHVVEFLILHGAQKEYINEDHHTPLSIAVSQNHVNVVKILFGETFENWTDPNRYEQGYIHLAPIFNVKSREMVQILVEKDARTVDIFNENGQLPLSVAAQNGYLDVVKYIVDLDGASYANYEDNDNKTALFYAEKNKHYHVVEFLKQQTLIHYN